MHPNYKQAVLDARDRSTAVTGQSLGHPVRCLRNKLTAEFERLEAERAPASEIEALGTGKLRAAVVDGDTEWGSLMSGQLPPGDPGTGSAAEGEEQSRS